MEKLLKKIHGVGGKNIFHFLVVRIINKLFYVKIFRCMILTMGTLDPKYLEVSNKYEKKFIDEITARRFASDEMELPEKFIGEAIEKADYCYGIFEGGSLASYGWYSKDTTEIEEGLEFCFNPEYVYMYKGFTHPMYRGLRLHGVGMANALKDLTDMGFKGLVSIVESTNFNSLRSVYRMGYRDLGKIVVLRVFRRSWFIELGDCKTHKCKIRPTDT